MAQDTCRKNSMIDAIDAIDEKLSRSTAILHAILSRKDTYLELEREELDRLIWIVRDYLEEISVINQKLLANDICN